MIDLQTQLISNPTDEQKDLQALINTDIANQQRAIDALNIKTTLQQTSINVHGQNIQRLMSQFGALNTSVNTNVVFSAAGINKNGYVPGEVLKFPSIVSNPQNAYERTTGEFTATASGWYHFIVSVQCYDIITPFTAFFQLKCGGTVVMSVYTNCPSSMGDNTSSGAAIAHVGQGGVCRVEAVKVSSLNSAGSGPGYTNSFTGFLIARD